MRILSEAGLQPIQVRALQRADIPAVIRLQNRACPLFLTWTPGQLKCHMRCFPKGQLVAFRGGRLVGACASLKLRLEAHEQPLDWMQITGQGYMHTHDSRGETLYVISMAYQADESRAEVRQALDQALLQLAAAERVSRLLVPVRLPGFAPLEAAMSRDAYMAGLADGTLPDTIFRDLARQGFRALGLLPDQHNRPRSSGQLAALMEWRAC